MTFPLIWSYHPFAFPFFQALSTTPPLTNRFESLLKTPNFERPAHPHQLIFKDWLLFWQWPSPFFFTPGRTPSNTSGGKPRIPSPLSPSSISPSSPSKDLFRKIYSWILDDSESFFPLRIETQGHTELPNSSCFAFERTRGSRRVGSALFFFFFFCYVHPQTTCVLIVPSLTDCGLFSVFLSL